MYVYIIALYDVITHQVYVSWTLPPVDYTTANRHNGRLSATLFVDQSGIVNVIYTVSRHNSHEICHQYFGGYCKPTYNNYMDSLKYQGHNHNRDIHQNLPIKRLSLMLDITIDT